MSRFTVQALGLVVAFGAFSSPVLGKDFLEVRARDQCDPVTFNAGRAQPLCSASHAGSVTLAEFQAALPAGGHGAWKFNPGPSGGHLDLGGVVRVASDAGETHTFTRVAAFGGGIVPPLNAAVANAPVRPECAAMQPVAGGPLVSTPGGVVVASGTSQLFQAGDTLLPQGIHLYQCCIHPWMRTIITVR